MKHFKRSRFLLLGILTGAGMLMNSCLEPGWDFNRISDEIVLSPGIAAPIAYGSFTVDDMLNEIDNTGYVEQFEDNLLYITYADEQISFPANQIVTIPDQTFLEAFLDTDIAINPGDEVARFYKDQDAVFVFENNERLDSIHVKTMDMVIDVRSSFKYEGQLTISSESVLVNGEPFKDIVQISDASGNFSYTHTIPMDGNTIYLDNSNPEFTVLPLSFELELINSGNPVLPSESCDITMTFVDPEFYAVFGYLGDYNLMLSDGSVTLDIFDTNDLEGGSLFFADPRFTLNVSNSYGIPVEIDISNLRAYSRINDLTTGIIFNAGVNPFSVAAPGLNQVGEEVTTLIEINKENCNIEDAMETFPNDFRFRVSALTNPEGSGMNNFITDSSNLKVDFEVTLPIWINSQGFNIDRTQEFDFMDYFGETSDIVDYFRLTMDVTNGLPAAIRMQAYFQDENFVTLDSLFKDDEFLLAPSVNADDKVEAPREQSKSVEFTKERIKNLEPVKHLLVRAWVNTTQADEGRFVKFYSYYTIDFKVKMKADLTINSRDL